MRASGSSLDTVAGLVGKMVCRLVAGGDRGGGGHLAFAVGVDARRRGVILYCCSCLAHEKVKGWGCD